MNRQVVVRDLSWEKDFRPGSPMADNRQLSEGRVRTVWRDNRCDGGDGQPMAIHESFVQLDFHVLHAAVAAAEDGLALPLCTEVRAWGMSMGGSGEDVHERHDRRRWPQSAPPRAVDNAAAAHTPKRSYMVRVVFLLSCWASAATSQGLTAKRGKSNYRQELRPPYVGKRAIFPPRCMWHAPSKAMLVKNRYFSTRGVFRT